MTETPPDPDNLPELKAYLHEKIAERVDAPCTGTHPCQTCRDRLAERADGTPVSPHEADRNRARRAGIGREISLAKVADAPLEWDDVTPDLIERLRQSYSVGGADASMLVLGDGTEYTATAVRDTYTRAVTVVDVIDGDTFRCEVDLGFYVRVRMSCRLAGLNAPELHEPGGPEVRKWLATFLAYAEDDPKASVVVQSVKPDKFAGRFDAVVLVDGNNVNEAMIRLGLAVAWDGTGPRPHVPWPPVLAEAPGNWTNGSGQKP